MANYKRDTANPDGNNDEETMSAIYRGLNQSQLMRLFRVDQRTVKKAIFESGAKPTARIFGADVYSVYELAPYLVRPVGDFESYLMKMNPEDLPKHLQKEFWAAMRSRQEWQKAAEHLWPTEKVVEHVGDLLKLIKMSALLMVDAADRQSTLSPQQRRIIKELTHGMLQDLKDRITKNFKVPENGKLPQRQDDEDI